MNYSKYKQGTVVSAITWPEEQEIFGHITRFARNAHGELILSILWEDGKETQVHPNNLIIWE